MRGRATLTAVIARLDRATRYSGLAVIHANAGVYWVPAFAGMTNLCAATARRTMTIGGYGSRRSPGRPWRALRFLSPAWVPSPGAVLLLDDHRYTTHAAG